MIAVVNIPSDDNMVATVEPLWLDWIASVVCTPAMTLVDLQKAGKHRENLAKERITRKNYSLFYSEEIL
jgi:hypothetical protein